MFSPRISILTHEKFYIFLVLIRVCVSVNLSKIELKNFLRSATLHSSAFIVYLLAFWSSWSSDVLLAT